MVVYHLRCTMAYGKQAIYCKVYKNLACIKLLGTVSMEVEKYCHNKKKKGWSGHQIRKHRRDDRLFMLFDNDKQHKQ